MSGERSSEDNGNERGGVASASSSVPIHPSSVEGHGSGEPGTQERPEMASDAGTTAMKHAPEGLAIRASVPRAVRFKRELIIIGTGIAVAALIGVGWMALRSRATMEVTAENDLSKPIQKPVNDTLSSLPRNYGEVPQLGPALPGDLGRPILSAQRDRAAKRDGDASAARTAAQQRKAEAKAALESGLLASARNTVGDAAARAGSSTPAAPATAPATGPVDAASTQASPTTQDRKKQFADTLDTRGDANPHAMSAGSPNILAAGSVIAASLITGLNSDVPGMVVAQVTQNVFDSATGEVLLIPQGARLTGTYDSAVSYGQQRALVVWQRLMLPDGSSLRLDNMPATDSSGNSGLHDRTNYHTGRLIKGVGIATMLGVATELSISGESDFVRAIRESAQTNTSRAGDQITQRNLDVQPTITVRPGAPVRLVVRQDLVLKPWKGDAR